MSFDAKAYMANWQAFREMNERAWADRSEKKAHNQDPDCTIDPNTGLCTVCGVYHGEPCFACGGRGFHLPNCSEGDHANGCECKECSAERDRYERNSGR